MTYDATATEHVVDADLGDGGTLRQMDLQSMIAERTGTEADDWEEFDGPESGVGVDYWYAHKVHGWQAYVVVDQDDVSISVTDEEGYEVDTSQEIEMDGEP